MEIFSRLSAKSIASCCCVSKPWASLLRRSDFRDLFLTRSLARPQLLFACQTYGELHFFSSHQPQNPDENSSPLVVNHHMKFPFDAYYSSNCHHVHGFVCLMQIVKRRDDTVTLIYNPSIGQSLLLPKAKTRWVRVGVRSLLGYDLIDKQFKLLSVIYGRVDLTQVEYHVLTLGTGNHSWRMIKCGRPHYPRNEGICIDGVLYYTASENIFSSYYSMIVWFDVRSEKLRFISVAETFITCGRTLVNYDDKLGLLDFERSSGSIELCVLEDAQKHEWLKHTYVLPVLWKNIVGTSFVFVVGMTRTNEIVLAAKFQTVPFYVFYYNIKRKTIIKFQIQGMEAFKDNRIYILLDHVEDLKRM